MCYNHPVYQLLTDSTLVQFDGKQVCGIYNYLNDPLLQYNLANEAVDSTQEAYLRAYIQQYIYRLTTNQLTIQTNGSTSR